MLSRKGVVVLICAIIICVLGMAVRDHQAIVLGMFLLVALVFSYRRLPGMIRMARSTFPPRIIEGDEARIRLSMWAADEESQDGGDGNEKNNKGRRGKGKDEGKARERRKKGSGKREAGRSDTGRAMLVEMKDELPGRLALSRESNHKLLYVPARRMRKMSYALYCPIRGYYNLGPAKLRLSDNFDLVCRETSVEEQFRLPVNLAHHKLRSFDMEIRAFDWNMGQNLLNIQGLSSDFYSLRDYTKQDSFRNINWKATARKRKIMVNTYERESLTDCCILIDARTATGLGRPHDNFLEYSVRLAYGLARTVIDDNNRLALATYGRSIRIVPPGLGRNHAAYIEALLLNVAPEGYVPLGTALVHTWPYLKPGSTVVIFSPMDFDWTFLSTLRLLQSMDMRILVVTSQLLNFESRASGVFNVKNRLDEVRFEMMMLELERMGVRTVEWSVDDSYDTVLRDINMASGSGRYG